ncbi:MAG: M48 family metalloprotease [Planctomycetota bacterium]|jgi:Zn-dependent protease with chaperone function|nr:M48 family metalloprotease [Planctomycetota bacterium]
MLIPFDLIAAMLYLGYYVARPVLSPPPATFSLAVVAGIGVLLALAGGLVNLAARRRIRRPGRTCLDRRRVAWTGETSARILLVAGYAAALNLSAFPWSLGAAFGWPPVPSAGVQLLALAPYALYFVCVWPPLYTLHKATSPGKWTRASFLVNKARYNLMLLVMWIPFTLFSDWLADALLLLPLLLFGSAWVFPRILTKLWGCEPLGDEETLALVDELGNRVGVRFSGTFVWEPGGGKMQNAAAVGIFPPFRYLFLTPALLANMRRDELSAVILHELGHVRKRHLLFYMITTLAGVNLAAVAGELPPVAGEFERFLAVAALILCYFRFVFGWLSRNMERQADLFPLRIMGSADSMVRALEKLGLSAGNVRNASSWHHLGIAERVRFLRLAERNPELMRLHDGSVRRLMAGGYVLSFATLLLIGAAVFEFGRADPPPLFRDREIAHWRRVTHLLPGSPVGRLELAYRLAADPGTRDEARRLAKEAASRATGTEEREAAEKLLRDLSGGEKWDG